MTDFHIWSHSGVGVGGGGGKDVVPTVFCFLVEQIVSFII